MPNNKKALLVTTVSGFIPQFEMNNVKILQDMGYEIHYAANYNTPSYGSDNHRLDGTGIIRHQIDFVRSPFKLSNFRVYRQLKKLMQEEHFELVHCHTPMGGVMARLAAHATHTKPVAYTAHGFHFFHGAPLINWLCYYPMERFLSHFTTQQICINREDYAFASKYFHAKYVNYIPGVGLDMSRIPHHDEKYLNTKREELNLPKDKFILLSSGELIKRKNHETILRALTELKEFPIHYVICGHGELDSYLKELTASLELSNIVSFLGYREDMIDIYQIADIFLFPSYQEGLPMSLLEAMACGLPVVCSNIRGCKDLMGKANKKNDTLIFCDGGIMIQKIDHPASYTQALKLLLENPEKLPEYGLANKKHSQNFSKEQVIERMKKIYKRMEIQ